MKAKPCNLIFYSYSGVIVHEVKCNSITMAKLYPKKKHNAYCWVIYDNETWGIIHEGLV